MLAHPNTCEASFIAILKPWQVFYAQNERKSRGEGNVVQGILIVHSLTVFYVTTTHGFSSTCGWVPGMCFLSLFLMTQVTSHVVHMLGGDEPLQGA